MYILIKQTTRYFFGRCEYCKKQMSWMECKRTIHVKCAEKYAQTYLDKILSIDDLGDVDDK